MRGTASSPPSYCKELVIVRQNAEQLQSFLKGGVHVNSKKKGMSLLGKQRAAGWTFLAPATIMIAIMSFYPMIRAFIISLQTGAGANMRFADPIFSNYKRILADKVFQQSIVNTFLYLIIQVPIMLILAILLAQLLNNKDLKFKGFFRTCVFLPCATSLVSYSLIFRSMFATDGLINSILIKLGILSTGYNFLGNSASAKIVIILALIWRWTGYNMVFYLAGLQNIEYSVYEAAKIDGCSYYTIFTKIIFPLMVPTMITGCIFSFMWRWDDFLGALLYVNKTEKYPVSLALKMFCDPSSSSDYGAMFAMATLSILPAVLIFFCLQRYLVEGISTSGLKG